MYGKNIFFLTLLITFNVTYTFRNSLSSSTSDLEYNDGNSDDSQSYSGEYENTDDTDSVASATTLDFINTLVAVAVEHTVIEGSSITIFCQEENCHLPFRSNLVDFNNQESVLESLAANLYEHYRANHVHDLHIIQAQHDSDSEYEL